VHAAKLEARAAPMVTTAHAIRAAKILRMAAIELGRPGDAAQYDADIARLTRAVQANAWDPATEYFGYVLHDAAGRPEGLLRTSSGENWNRTLDGVQPLVAGITTPEQTRAILANLKDPAKLLSPVGITAVDRSASYYRPDGYWNGTVWFPHQWFIWKALLDQGEGAFAWQIARTALEAYQAEAEASWTSAEHFEIATGQGVGWHQFSGLSSPVANWFQAYLVPGKLTTGSDVWVRSLACRSDNRGMTARK
jgi:glycogen debranching enzyme